MAPDGSASKRAKARPKHLYTRKCAEMLRTHLRRGDVSRCKHTMTLGHSRCRRMVPCRQRQGGQLVRPLPLATLRVVLED